MIKKKEVISVRISRDLLEELDRKSTAIGISRNELINLCISFALDHMEETIDA